MKPFKLIQGSSNNISKFEDDIAQAIEDGYEFGGEIICKKVENSNKSVDILFFQPMTVEEHLEFEDDDLDYPDNDDETEL